MALLISKIPQAISQVMAGIDDGLSQAANYVDSVRPPGKVVFSVDAIVGLNSIERVVEISSESSTKATINYSLIETTAFNDDQTGLLPLPPVALQTTIETINTGVVYKRTQEDQSVGFQFEYPGPKST